MGSVPVGQGRYCHKKVLEPFNNGKTGIISQLRSLESLAYIVTLHIDERAVINDYFRYKGKSKQHILARNIIVSVTRAYGNHLWGPAPLSSRGTSRTEDSRESDALSGKASKGTLVFLAVMSY